MKMHWNWDTRIEEIIFSWWTATTPLGFLGSILAVAILAAIYQYITAYRIYKERLSRQMVLGEEADGDPEDELVGSSLERAILLGRTVPRRIGSIMHVRWPNQSYARLPGWKRANLAVIFGLQTYLSVLLMLIMMTYNGYLILGLIAGAVVGYYRFGGGSCHF